MTNEDEKQTVVISTPGGQSRRRQLKCEVQGMRAGLFIFFIFFLTPSDWSSLSFFSAFAPVPSFSFFLFLFFSPAPTQQTHQLSSSQPWPKTQQGHSKRTPRLPQGAPQRRPPLLSLPDSSRPLVSSPSSAMTEVLFIIFFHHHRHSIEPSSSLGRGSSSRLRVLPLYVLYLTFVYWMHRLELYTL